MSAKIDITDLIIEGLLEDIKGRVKEEVTNKIIAEFKGEVEDIVVRELERLTLSDVEAFRNSMKMRDEYLVHFIHGGKE